MGAKSSTPKTEHIQKYRPPRRGSEKCINQVQTDVSMQITQHVALTEGKDANMVLCPLLIQLVLSLIALGSNGPTREQMLWFLRSKSVSELHLHSWDLTRLTFSDGCAAGGPKLSFVNSVWVDESIYLKQTFKRVLDRVYRARFEQVDFKTKAGEFGRKVNSWVENNTNGLIKELLSPDSVDANTRLIFANALYFKGTWFSKFDHSRTSDSDFHLLHGGSVTVPFMTTNSDQYISSFAGFKVLRLCYEKGSDSRQFSMYIVLPDAKDGLPSLLQKVCSQPKFLESHMPKVHVPVKKFMIPRFKIAFVLDASRSLKQLGVTQPFLNPDLSEMLEPQVGQQLCVSRIFHKAVIEVNEDGTEAAAASASIFMLKSIDYQDNRLDFVADHPFMFLVREDVSASVLFIGHVMNPLQTAA
ncbi:hypothetical protein RND81_01G226000 [Saponaria officinalis]|uniref:Serpin domain-containing protein n=1 Tax=Saponaria officinalis TaxID=3572 RepID=A0AAW1NC08_SAPOF